MTIKKSIKRLKHPNDIRKFLASIINQANNGEIDINKASKLAYMLNTLIKIVDVVHEHDVIIPLYNEVDELEKK